MTTEAMTAEEQLLADDIYSAINRASNYSDRSMQGRNFQAGVSDLGFCSERVRRMLDQQVPEDTDALTAFIGTALGDHAERAIQAHLWPDALLQAEVKVTFDGDQLTYTLTGHPDVVRPQGLMLDGKTDYGLADVQRNGATQQQRFQRHLYGYGAHTSGLFDAGVKLEDVRVGNFWIDRAGKDKGLHVEVEALDMGVVREASEWLDEVTYAYIHEEEARKEPPREVCFATCGFFDVCRAYDTDVEGLITEERTLAAVEQYVDGAVLEKEGKRLREQAKQHLVDVSGSTGEHLVRWTWINPTVIPESSRRGYYKLDVRPVKRKR